MTKKENKQQLTTEELKKVQDLAQKSNNLVYDLGLLSIRNNAVTQAHAAVTKEMNELKADLQKIYGEVNIDLKDGTISPLEKKEEEEVKEEECKDCPEEKEEDKK